MLPFASTDLVASTDLISGTNWDDVAITVVGVLVLVTTAAALAHKPPLLQVGRFIGWVFGRLIGEPIAGWLGKLFDARVRPLVREEVEIAVAPIRREQASVATDLRAHIAQEETDAASLALWRDGLDVWRDDVDGKLDAITGLGPEGA